MTEPFLEAFISQDRTFSLRCPSCYAWRQHDVCELPAGFPNPLLYECECGAVATLRLVGYRMAKRKPTSLVASFSRPSQNGRVRTLGTVLDISAKGMRFSTEPVRDMELGEELNISLILDDTKRTKLKLRSKVQRLNRDEGNFEVAVEFFNATEDQIETLKRYVLA